ncbi:hypothetical protein [Desertivirga brevis]|uniref:hypothetical protein n=1 Tax=Desertivirga brevis TaxID=2810310 RepID=UPI001A959DEF|nr:hypothetical protein [Pedobacter sp. SYSU D00873]
MKTYLFLLLTFLATTTIAQDKNNYVWFNKLSDLEGTDYVIATLDNRNKIATKNSLLLFINTKTGESKKIDFPKSGYIDKIEQIKIDKFNLNKVIIAAKTVNLDGNKSIDWTDPMQIIVLSTDGTEKVLITDDKFFVRTWVINKQTGIIVITGHYDTNNNGKYDKSDKNQIILYDLNIMKTTGRI